MFKKQHSSRGLERVDTIIGKHTIFEGTVRGQGLVRVDGQIEGEIVTEGDLVVGEGARVIGDVRARNVTLAGEVHGNIYANGRLELIPGGRLKGDIRAARLIVADGAVFDGNIAMETANEASEG